MDEADAPVVAETLALAFADDPVWGVALAELDVSQRATFWSFFVRGALTYGTVWTTPDTAAVATWIPPDGVELPGELEAEMFAFATSVLSPDAVAALEELWERFDAAHPHHEPHAYLSLLATHPSRRGHGIGQQLLATTLEGWDAQGIPSYLESTNPGNNHRYQRAGFEAVGGFDAPLNGARITTMWRVVTAD
ncbi:MAG TPA: GNAT family N-acetyltransferase [Rhodoglobus sp.]|nr:GNAT family N-acetyltransferase [Rhodoglobus sp.]HPM51641.1 GNAT family N-acetyltransferase [Rhodoglobus sp.]